MQTNSFTILLLLPEIALVMMACWMFLVGGTTRDDRSNWPLFTVVSFLIGGFALGMQLMWLSSPDTNETLAAFVTGEWSGATGPLILDCLAYSNRWLALLVGLGFALTAVHGGGKRLSAEYLGTLILLVVGLMLTGAAGDLVLLFVSLELISIPTYVLLFLGRADRQSGEAAIKYFFLSVLSTAMLLYGFSLLYGAAGSTSLSVIAASFEADAAAGGASAFAPAALILVLAGLGFKIAAVPFHFYAPDVYQGTTNANAGVLAVAPKIAGVVVLVRLVAVAMPGLERQAWQVLLILSLLTMTIGNVSALWQKNIRRMLAYSSIAHAGYMLIGLSAGLAMADAGGDVREGAAALLFYLLVYVFATLGGFAVLAALSSPGHELSRVSELAGLARRRPLLAGAMAVCLFSLTGLPPLAGFWGKFALLAGALSAAWQAGGSAASGWFITLAVVTVLNAAISAAYYLRIVGVMYFQEESAAAPHEGPRGAAWSAVFCAAAVLLVGFAPGRAIDAARGASRGAAGARVTYESAEAVSGTTGDRPKGIAATVAVDK